MKRRYQTHTLTIPVETAANARGNGEAIKLDPNYQKCIGIQVFETGDATQKYRLSLLAGGGGSGTIIDLTYKEFFQADKSVAKDKRNTDIELTAMGQEYMIGWEALAQISANVVLDVVFELVNE